MPEETAVAASSSTEAVEEKPCSSSTAESSVDVAEEAKKLIGTGNRHLVMGDVVSAVSVFQEACAMLAEKYGDTADECGEAFFLCGKSLLELARMENSVLGNALEGVPEESSEEGEKQNDSKIESADNLDEKTRDDLREQVYEAMSEKRDSQEGEPKMYKEQEVKEEQLEDGEAAAANRETTEEPGATSRETTGEAAAANRETTEEPGATSRETTGEAAAANRETTEEPGATSRETSGEAAAANRETTEEPGATSRETTGEAAAANRETTEEPGATSRETTGEAAAANRETTEEPGATSRETIGEAAAANRETTEEPGATSRETTGEAAAANRETTEEPGAASRETTGEAGAASGGMTEEVGAANRGKFEAAVEAEKSTENLQIEVQTAESVREELDKEISLKQDGAEVAKEDAVRDVKSTEEQGGNEEPEPMTEDAGDAEDDDEDDDEEADANAEDKEGEEEDVGNLQLAWEMLEVAKVIYKRKESKEDQLIAAQIFLKLGEVGAESGNYSQALEDFQECLAIQLKHLSPHSRLLAETHYQLGMTFSYTGQYSQSIQHFSSSIKVIESRLAMLQEVIDKTEGAEGAAEEKRELEELKQLLPEIAEKVEDAKESQRTAAAASEAIHQTLGGASTSSGFATENGASSSTAAQIAVKPADGASSSKSVSDISHLVRKKRKPEDESPKKDSDAKKVKQETTVNGSADSANNSNGVQEKMEQEA
ncbi:hypothetical protein QTP70_030535, partial [Hemibagrus guttatus]